jgi:alpha-D-ribose 1-methylphosphonate 5-triphosphate synthase subunit PhnG
LDKQKCLGTVKTKAEAQAIVDAEVQAAQAAWDALPAEQQAMRDRPADIVLE